MIKSDTGIKKVVLKSQLAAGLQSWNEYREKKSFLRFKAIWKKILNKHEIFNESVFKLESTVKVAIFLFSGNKEEWLSFLSPRRNKRSS